MKRLFTFGCSYTEYHWPSWADLIGTEFDYFENWGVRGIGNRGIAERISECHMTHNFTKDDTIIVQWSTHLRFDWYKEVPGPDHREAGWKTCGSIFAYYNSKIFDKKWIDLFFSEPAYMMHTFNHIGLVQGLLESTGCTWYMTSIGDLRNAGADITVSNLFKEYSIHSNFEHKNTIIQDHYPHFKFYEEAIWDRYSSHWLKPIHLFSNESHDKYWWFREDEQSSWRETHPSITHYRNWIFTELKDKISLSTTTLSEIDKITDSIEDLKQSSFDFVNFIEELHKNNFYRPDKFSWPRIVYGF